MSDLRVRVPDQLDERLREASEKTGLQLSEITRMGLVKQLNEIEGQR